MVHAEEACTPVAVYRCRLSRLSRCKVCTRACMHAANQQDRTHLDSGIRGCPMHMRHTCQHVHTCTRCISSCAQTPIPRVAVRYNCCSTPPCFRACSQCVHHLELCKGAWWCWQRGPRRSGHRHRLHHQQQAGACAHPWHMKWAYSEQGQDNMGPTPFASSMPVSKHILMCPACSCMIAALS